ncbi:MAG: hypothetical protein K2W96_00940 [Gemmataceae bacterium]|nr:hypothetical protein [Gemmataceae bacterium]
MFIPSLGALLTRAEELKDAPLTEDECLRIRDACINDPSRCVRMTREQADGIAERRGYADINPDDCWTDWQRVRAGLR